MAMGLTLHAELEVVRYAPLGDPIQIKVRNTYLSLRKDEAVLLKLKRV
jgi:ferrous iron transport protein A